MAGSYRRALEDAKKELAGLVKQRAELDQRIERLARSIEGLAPLCDGEDFKGFIQGVMRGMHGGSLPSEDDDLSLSDSIRRIIANSLFAISVTEIRDALVTEGFDPNRYANFLTVIHNTLRRLQKQGEIRFHRGLVGPQGWVTVQTRSGTIELTPRPDRQK